MKLTLICGTKDLRSLYRYYRLYTSHHHLSNIPPSEHVNDAMSIIKQLFAICHHRRKKFCLHPHLGGNEVSYKLYQNIKNLPYNFT